MKWIDRFQLFLFDLDGLLVNTEELHFLAYKQMLSARGFQLPWDFNRYCSTAHYHSDKIAEEFYAMFPDLLVQEPSWDILYQEKKEAIMSLLRAGAVHLMPGVAQLLNELQTTNSKHCVVTHSADELVSVIRQQHPILNSIPFWITRHDYTHPKPHPECYLKAIKEYAQPGDSIIGFEDTPRGLNALMGTPAKPVLVTQVNYPEIPGFIRQGVLHYQTFQELLQTDLT